MTALLEIDDLVKRFGGLRALDGCTFRVAPGTITGLIGPNGAGKTTVFNVVSGLLAPDAGTIRFGGRPIGGRPAHEVARLGIRRTFQIPREFRQLTVLENLLVFGAAPVGERLTGALFRRRVYRDEDRLLLERAEAVLAITDLAPLADEYARNLSGGQKKLLELARVLMAEPALVLLDEPAAGVNPTLMNRLVEVIRTEHRRGRTFLVIEHDMGLVMRLCDPVIVLSQGRTLTEGPFEAVRRDPTVLEHYFGRMPVPSTPVRA
jgi:branched-chain amino acid transport system ATP-binding protein